MDEECYEKFSLEKITEALYRKKICMGSAGQ